MEDGYRVVGAVVCGCGEVKTLYVKDDGGAPPSPPRGEPVKLNEQVGGGSRKRKAPVLTKECACGARIKNHFEDCWNCAQRKLKRQREDALLGIETQNDIGSSVAMLPGVEGEEVKELLEKVE